MMGGALEVLAGEYEPGIPLKTGWRPRVLDIGANVGAFGAWALHRWPGCLVESYEPNPRAFAVLEENSADRRVAWKVYPCGLGAGVGRAFLHEGLLNLGEASIHPDVGGNKPDAVVEVPIDDAGYLPEGQILKVDTEGCELEILDRYLTTHDTAPTLVLLEYHRALDRLMLEQLLGWYGLALLRGVLVTAVRGTLVFGRMRGEPLRGRVRGDLEELRAELAPLAGLVRGAGQAP